MLVQPFALVLYTYSFLVILAGSVGVRGHESLSGVGRGRDRLARHPEALRRLHGGARSSFTIRDGEFFVLLGPSAVARPPPCE